MHKVLNHIVTILLEEGRLEGYTEVYSSKLDSESRVISHNILL